jgi:hypothetical protein
MNEAYEELAELVGKALAEKWYKECQEGKHQSAEKKVESGPKRDENIGC